MPSLFETCRLECTTGVALELTKQLHNQYTTVDESKVGVPASKRELRYNLGRQILCGHEQIVLS